MSIPKRFLMGMLLLLAACRPAATNEVAPPISPTVVEEATAVPTVAVQAPVSTPAAQEIPSVEELMARIPTPAPDAIIPTPAGLQAEQQTTRGSADAPITIVEFSDYQCPYCQRYVDETYQRIIDDFVATGRVRYVFKDFPLEGLHPQASQAAEAARCAGEQDAYWEMHDRLFANQAQWGGQEAPLPVFLELGDGLNLDQDALQECLNSGRYQETVQQNLAEGLALGVTGTPTFFINGYPLVGARQYEVFELAFTLAEAGRLSDAYAQPPTPTPMPASEIPTGNAPVMGSADATVMMIEFSDYQCPYCGRYNAQTFTLIKEKYIDTGKIRYVFKDFPLSFHEQATLAAYAARCAGDQGDYWGMHDLLFANQGEWGNAGALDVFQRYAAELDLDANALATCVTSDGYAGAVQSDLQEGMSLGVSGTPAFFVGNRFISGAQPFEVFEQAIEEALGG